MDDDDQVRPVIEALLVRSGYETYSASNGEEAREMAARFPVDIALLDYQLPDTNGVDLMQQLREIVPGLHTLIVTGYGTIERAVEAMQAGAWDFIPKPLTANMLLSKLQRVEEFCYLRREHDFHQKALQGEFEFSGVVGSSLVMKSTYETILRAGASHLPVLIEGETGSGKEYIAEAIHLNSKRKSKPFVILDCTATPTSLFESTLFGSTKGAFTGAVERKGLLETADGGTLFLDEVGEISMEIQPKLLRCLETKRFRPVGGTKETYSDFRIICATNRNLLDETKKGAFRSDLFYRISAQRIIAPPLRERPTDIPLLAQHFLNQIIQDHGDEPCEFTPTALHKMSVYHWPGNIRQLKFVVESAYFSRMGNRIDADHLLLDGVTNEIHPEPHAYQINPNQDFKTYRDHAILEAERLYLKSLLEINHGDVRKAAEQAGLTREALYRVMSRCNLSPSDFRKSGKDEAESNFSPA